jgi:predicted AAA+ superfamily ATPase
MIARPVYLEKLIRYKDKDLIKVITGIRRCGKSVLLFDIYTRYLLDLGIPEDHILKINLENKENSPLRDADALYQFILNRISGSGKYYVMIDEIQYVTGFEDLVNSLKNKGCDVYITGSNSRLLSGDISTALRGRSIEIKVYTLSFAEYASASADDHRKAFNDYLLYGGFPYAATELDTRSKIDYLKMLESTVATKDIIDRHRIRNANLFYAVYDFLCSNIGSTVSAKKITDTLRSNGYSSLSPDTVDSYLQYLCEAFLFYKVYRYDIRGREYLKTQNKYYISDLGLRNVRLNYRQLEITHSLENVIYLELIRRGYRVDIGKNKEKEIDFIASGIKDSYYIQAAYTLAGEDKKKQELDSFRNIADGYKKIVITMDEDPFIILENGFKKINVIDFLLNADSLETI